MHHVIARLSSKRPSARDAWDISVEAPEIAAQAVPGQFVHLRIPANTCDPLLRRPFAIARAEHGQIRLIVDVVGRGTEMIARLEIGDELDLLGPIGRGWRTPPDANGPLALVAGGTGVASLMAFHTAAPRKDRLHPLIGARTRDRLLAADYFRHAPNARLATDDGSEGFHGTVVGLLEHAWEEVNPLVILACGPMPMLARVARLAAQRGAACEVSLEQRMGCGFGVCMGCAIAMRSGGYARVCVDGPVFDAAEVAWE